MTRFLLLLLLLLPLVVGGVVGGVVVFVGFGFGVVVGVAPDVAHKTGQQQQASQRCRRRADSNRHLDKTMQHHVASHNRFVLLTACCRSRPTILLWFIETSLSLKVIFFPSMCCPYTVTPARARSLLVAALHLYHRTTHGLQFPWKGTGASESGSFYATRMLFLVTFSTEHMFQGIFQGTKKEAGNPALIVGTRKMQEWKRGAGTQNRIPRKKNTAGTESRNAGTQKRIPCFSFYKPCYNLVLVAFRCMTPQQRFQYLTNFGCNYRGHRHGTQLFLNPARPEWTPWNGDLNLLMAAAARQRQREERRKCKIK